MTSAAAPVGYTRARSMGNVVEAVRRAGGSVARVFRRAELPMRLVDHPDQVILLRDQLALVEYAVAETGDEVLAPRLSLQAGFRSLGPFADHVAAAPTLEAAIHRCNQGIGPLLQTATHMDLRIRAGVATWRYRISDTAPVGRHHNEMLALGYMADILRHFAGHGAVPLRAVINGRAEHRWPLQALLGCDVLVGDCAALQFDVQRLALPNPAMQPSATGQTVPMPDACDLLAGVAQLMRLALLEERPTITWMARRLGLPQRTLQRRLRDEGSSFEALREHALMGKAAELLESSGLSISDIALELGYSGPAQFTRAANRWSGLPPRAWRHKLQGRLAGAGCKEPGPA
ncbi:MAG: AraC family transcriptional regulator ligand-binding domain-containing protein [Burkholderiales bacterium]|nr:AraC family transcriptional regulator ligand-binding domain-containing protein [Burkholderiales bacterium]